MHTLWLRAETKLNERRTPLIPAHARILVKNGYRVCVEASRDRIFSDSAYRKQGCILVEKGSWRFASRDTLILGLKELPEALLSAEASTLLLCACLRETNRFSRFARAIQERRWVSLRSGADQGPLRRTARYRRRRLPGWIVCRNGLSGHLEAETM